MAKKAVATICADVYTAAKSTIATKLKVLSSKSKIDSISRNLRDVRLVKTIWQFDRPVDLFDFYYPSKIEHLNRRMSVTDLSQLPPTNHIVQGTVGQGKSIFLRYLTCQELIRGKAIPILFELRKIKLGQRLIQRILDEMDLLGFPADSDVFDAFARQGKMNLFLDGFDEIPEALRQDVIGDIESLCRKYDNMRMVITARPDSGIQNSSLFQIVRLSPFKAQEYKDVIRRICHDKDIASQIVSGIMRAKNVRSILTTPLMVTLLVFRYRLDQTIPENVGEFYGDLFSVLLQRHDKSKPGYTRPRISGASDTAMRETFDAFCYLTRKDHESDLSSGEIGRYVKQALNVCELSLNEDHVVADLTSITCLVQREGDAFNFVHKSVQEYHAAAFIASRPDDIARKFYEAMSARWMEWREEIFFLEQLDRYRCTSWFVLPQLEALLGYDGLAYRQPTVSDVERIFGGYRIGFLGTELNKIIFGPSTTRYYPLPTNLVVKHLIEIPLTSIDLTNSAVRTMSFPPSAGDAPGVAHVEYEISIKDMLGMEAARPRLVKMAEEAFRGAVEAAGNARQFIGRVRKTKELFEL